jgi:hypothetical protein
MSAKERAMNRARASLRNGLVIACGLPLLGVGSARAQAARAPTSQLSDQDRTEIQQLLARYQRALSSCASQEYAELFTPDGVFTSDDFRGPKHRELYGKSGTLQGRAKLKELVETEEFCLDPALRAARAVRGNAAGRGPSDAAIESTADGARGVIPLAGGGRYEDVYVKTKDGWRFKSRRVFMPAGSGRESAPPASSRGQE